MGPGRVEERLMLLSSQIEASLQCMVYAMRNDGKKAMECAELAHRYFLAQGAFESGGVEDSNEEEEVTEEA